MEKADNSGFLAPLSGRERQILVRAARGHTDQAIANHLGISLGTIGTYWGRIRSKLGHFNRTELVARYLEAESAESLVFLRERNRQLQAQIEQERAGLEMLQAVIDSAAEAILVVNEAGEIQLANEDAAEMFGYPKQELGAMKVADLMPERFRQVHDGHRAAYLANPQKKRMGEHRATLARRKDGSEFPTTTLLSSTQTPQGTIVTCIVRDLTREPEITDAVTGE